MLLKCNATLDRFVLQNLSFLNPENRKHSKCNIEAVIIRFCKERVEITTAKLQYSAYRNDDSLDFLFLNSSKRADIFFLQLSKMPECIQFGLLSLIRLCMNPDTVTRLFKYEPDERHSQQD